LDEPLYHYWIDPDVKDDSNSLKITTRHVLSHQTGFVNWRWLHPTKKLAFDFEPGTGGKFKYSGEGFEYLKKALEKKFRLPLDRLCDSLVFQPLMMHDSWLTWNSQAVESRFAKWHDKEGNNTYETSKSESPSAADDMLTTVDDYSRFGLAILNGFGLPEQLFKEMVTPTAPVGKNSSMGLGWELFRGLPGGEYAMMHTGSDKGVKTLVLLFPHSKDGLVVFTNSDNGYLLYKEIVIAVFGEKGLALIKQVDR
jgi:CubicO group peptidase (beta-lactamase class C family)